MVALLDLKEILFGTVGSTMISIVVVFWDLPGRAEIIENKTT